MCYDYSSNLTQFPSYCGPTVDKYLLNTCIATMWRETLVVGKFGDLSAKSSLAKQNLANAVWSAPHAIKF